MKMDVLYRSYPEKFENNIFSNNCKKMLDMYSKSRVISQIYADEQRIKKILYSTDFDAMLNFNTDKLG